MTLTGPDGASGRWSCRRPSRGFRARRSHVEDNGLYRASDGEQSRSVNVGPDNPLELQEVVSTTSHLQPLAEATGGAAKRLGDPRALRLVAMRESPIYAGAGYVGIKRHGRQRADRRLALAAGAGLGRAAGAGRGAGGDVVGESGQAVGEAIGLALSRWIYDRNA